MSQPVPIQQVISTAKANGWQSQDLVTAIAIVLTENGSLDAKAVGGPNGDGTFDFGLWQINSVHKPTEAQKFNYAANTKLARRIYVDAKKSFTPWATYNDGSYGKNVPKAMAAMHEMAKVSGDKSLDPPFTSPDGQGSKLKAHSLGAINDKAASLIPALPDVSGMVAKMGGNFITVLIALVLFVVGILIIMRMPVGTAVGKVAKVLPVGKVAEAVT